MARIRSIKPEFFVDEELQDLEAANPGAYCMLVFAGLWGHCSKTGVFEYKPRVLKLSILPFLNFVLADTLALLETAGFIRRFCADGKEYGYIPGFEKHQRISGKEAQFSPALPCFIPDSQRGSNREATGKQQGSEEEAQEKEKEKERNNYQQQQANAGEQVRVVSTTRRSDLERLFPAIDLDVALEKLMNRCRGKPVLLDPYETVLKWLQTEFKPVKGDANGPGSAGRTRAVGVKTPGIIPPNGPDADWLAGSQFADASG